MAPLVRVKDYSRQEIKVQVSSNFPTCVPPASSSSLYLSLSRQSRLASIALIPAVLKADVRSINSLARKNTKITDPLI